MIDLFAEKENTTQSEAHSKILAIYDYIYNIIPHKSFFVSLNILAA